MKKSLLILLFLSVCTGLFAQKEEQNRVAIQLKFEEAKTDSLRVTYLLELNATYTEAHIKQSRKTLLEALNICLKNNQNQLFWSKKIAFIYDSLGILSRKESDYKQALSYYLKALSVKEKHQDSINIGRSYHNIAILFNSLKNYDNAIMYIQKALPFRLKYNDSTDYGKSLRAYGNIKKNQNQKDSALFYYTKAKRFLTTDNEITALNNDITALYSANGDYAKAIHLYKNNLKIFKANQQLERISYTSRYIARSYRKLNQSQKGTKYLDTSETIARQTGNKRLLYLTYLERYKVAKLNRNPVEAIKYYQTYRRYKDSVISTKNTAALKTLEFNYLSEKKHLRDSLQIVSEKRILKIKAKNQEEQKWLYASLFGITALGFIALFLFYLNKRSLNKKVLEKQLLEKELLNEKLAFIQHRAERLTVDNKMRLDYKRELLQKIKTLKQVQNTTPIQEYQSLITGLQTQISTETRLDALTKNTIKRDIDFESKLNDQFPDLTKSEREICSLIQMNLSLKEIMNIRNTSVASIKSSRYRIRKKMNVPKGEDLELFIQNLF